MEPKTKKVEKRETKKFLKTDMLRSIGKQSGSFRDEYGLQLGA